MFRLLFVLSTVLAIGFGFKIPSERLLDNRIVGGSDTTIEDHPYQVSLRYYGYHRCGGSIIGRRAILTAAHCVYGFSAEDLGILAGVTNLDSIGELYSVEKTIVHEIYGKLDYMDFDVALVILKNEVIFSSKVNKIDLAYFDPADNENVTVTGWGSIVEGGTAHTILQQVSVPIVSRQRCQSYYQKVTEITENMICAGISEGGKDSCQGDSGGPLVLAGVDHELVGVVSWGYGCARPNYPGVYASVATLRNWISKKAAPYL